MELELGIFGCGSVKVKVPLFKNLLYFGVILILWHGFQILILVYIYLLKMNQLKNRIYFIDQL